MKIFSPRNADETLRRVRDLSEHKIKRSCRRDFPCVKVMVNRGEWFLKPRIILSDNFNLSAQSNSCALWRVYPGKTVTIIGVATNILMYSSTP